MHENTAKIVIENQTLRWSTTSQLNDPFEMLFDLSIRGNKEEIRNRTLEKLWELYSSGEPITPANMVGIAFELLRQKVRGMTKERIFSEFGPAIDEGLAIIERSAEQNASMLVPMFAQIKILSLTVRPDINLMWAHYANAHRGIAIRLRNIPAIGSPYGMAKPMIYSSEPPEFFKEAYLINAFCGIETMNTREITESIVFRKSLDWQYEQEWRISTGHGRNVDQPYQDAPFGSNELDGVIFGLNTSEADKTEIRRLCERYPNVGFMQAHRVLGSSSLDIQDIF